MADPQLEPGTEAPGFTLPDPGGAGVSLEDFRGSWVVLYFYPRDDTPGCTAEAVDFTGGLPGFSTMNAVVIGVSPDNGARHGKFITKHGLGIRLLSDTAREVIKRYGAWRIKKMYGKESYGVVRSTFLIDPSGIIRRRWDKVKVAGHAEDVLNALKGFVSQ